MMYYMHTDGFNVWRERHAVDLVAGHTCVQCGQEAVWMPRGTKDMARHPYALCPDCGGEGLTGKDCPHCGIYNDLVCRRHEQKVGTWRCGQCGRFMSNLIR